MEVSIGRGKVARVAYGFDDVALVPAAQMVDPDDVDVKLQIGELVLEIPILASAMDAVVPTVRTNAHSAITFHLHLLKIDRNLLSQVRADASKPIQQHLTTLTALFARWWCFR